MAGIVEAAGETVSAFKKGDIHYQDGLGGLHRVCSGSPSHCLHTSPKNWTLNKKLPSASHVLMLIKSAPQCPCESWRKCSGAGGGAGRAACQMVRASGLKILGTATTEEGQKIVLQNEAHEVFNQKEANNIDKTKKSVGEKRVDMIIEMFANVKLSEDLNFLSHGGQVIVVGHRGPIEINPQDP